MRADRYDAVSCRERGNVLSVQGYGFLWGARCSSSGSRTKIALTLVIRCCWALVVALETTTRCCL